MEPTSEQELKILFEEGKITDEEYRQLLKAIHQKQKPQLPVEKPLQADVRIGYGKAALILFILSVILPLIPISFAIISRLLHIMVLVKLTLLLVPLILFGLLCALLAFIFGIIGFKSPAGKIAAIGVPCLGVIAAVALVLQFYVFMNVRTEVPQIRSFTYHKAYPLDSLEGVLAKNNVQFFPTYSSDGNGSLRVMSDALEKTTVRLFETGPMSIENRMLIYQAKIKTDLSIGIAYLEMWCDIPGKGEFFSRSLEQPIALTTEWTTAQTSFRLEAGQMPANVKLNVVIEGKGIVWIDDIKLISCPLD